MTTSRTVVYKGSERELGLQMQMWSVSMAWNVPHCGFADDNGTTMVEYLYATGVTLDSPKLATLMLHASTAAQNRLSKSSSPGLFKLKSFSNGAARRLENHVICLSRVPAIGEPK